MRRIERCGLKDSCEIIVWAAFSGGEGEANREGSLVLSA